MTIDNLLNRVKALDTDKIAVEALTDTKDTIASLNKSQLAKGINSQGEIVGIYSSTQYAAFKKAKGSQAPFGIVDLKLTGSFYGGIKTDVSNNSVITESTDIKNDELEGKYNKNGNIFGLNKVSKSEYIKADLRPAFNSKIAKVLNLKI